MNRMGFILLCFVFLCISKSFSELKQSLNFKNISGDDITISILQHPLDFGKNIHLQLISPDGEGPFPLVVYLHGRNIGPSMLSSFASEKYFREWLDMKIAVLIPSFPGFAYSDGPCDYCGDFTLKALQECISYTKHQKKIIKDKTAIVGFGMGAIAATMLGISRDDLTCIVASNGAYNLHEVFAQSFSLKWNFKNLNFFPMEKDEISKRSTYSNLEKIKAPILFLHSENDPVISHYQSIRAHQKLQHVNKNSSLVLVKFNGHNIPKKYYFPPITAFLEKHLLKGD